MSGPFYPSPDSQASPFNTNVDMGIGTGIDIGINMGIDIGIGTNMDTLPDTIGSALPSTAMTDTATFRACLEVTRLILTDVPRLANICKASDPIVTEFIGSHFFRTYAAKNRGDLSAFLYMINEHPPLAEYVQEVYFDGYLDGPKSSYVLQMLFDVYERNKKAAAHSVSDSGFVDSDSVVDDDVQQEPRRGTSSAILRQVAEDFFLLSLGDSRDVPDSLYFGIVQELLCVLPNVQVAHVPILWAVNYGFHIVTRRVEYILPREPRGVSQRS